MIRTLPLAVLVLGLGFHLAVEAGGPADVSKEDIAQLIHHDAKNLQDLFAKPKLDTKRLGRVKMGAWMVAAYAQHAGMIDLRQQALSIIDKVDKDPAEAKKLASQLKPGGTGGGSGVELAKKIDIEMFMKMFSSERAGGYGLENSLDKLLDVKEKLDAADKEKAQILANKISMMALHMASFAPGQDQGAKTKKAWQEFSKATHGASKDLVNAVRKNDGVSAAAMKLSESCTKCHDVFRIN
jgi:hypothetical protein